MRSGERNPASLRKTSRRAYGEPFSWRFPTNSAGLSSPRKQERDRDGVLHAVRRYRGRLRGHQGRAENHGVPHLPIHQRAGGPRYHPESVITRPPSAELRPDQKDSDSLPPYDILDPILKCYIEEDLGLDEIVARIRSGYRTPRVPPFRYERIKTPSGAAGGQDHPPVVRSRPPAAHHQPFPRHRGRRMRSGSRRYGEMIFSRGDASWNVQ